MHYIKIANKAEFTIIQYNSRVFNNYKNDNIDVQKSKHNKDLMTVICPNDHRLPYEKFQSRLKELSYRKQRNNVRMCEIVLTLPKNVPQAEMWRFFETGLKELLKQVGGVDNIVGAFVHLDETTPHMHIDFVPGIEVDGILKLSAKTLIDINKLKKLHPTLQKAIDEEFGHHKYFVVADDPADRAKSSESLQAFKATKAKEDQLKLQYQSIKDTYNKVTYDLISVQDIVDNLKASIEMIKGDKAIFNQESTKMIEYCQELHQKINDICKQFEQVELTDIFSDESELLMERKEED